MAGISHADQGRFPLPRLHPCRANRPRSRSFHGSGKAHSKPQGYRNPGMAELLLQVADVRAGAISGARFVYPVDEAEKHVAVYQGRAVDHPPRSRVLRLSLDELIKTKPR